MHTLAIIALYAASVYLVTHGAIKLGYRYLVGPQINNIDVERV